MKKQWYFGDIRIAFWILGCVEYIIEIRVIEPNSVYCQYENDNIEFFIK